jgi:DNA polymerase-3 subunit beta
MKLTVNKTAIVKALADLSGAISSKTTLPILGNVKMTVEASFLKMEATDLDLVVRCSVPVEDAEPGETTLPAKRLLQLLREIPTDVARIEISNDAATVTSGTSRFKLLGLPAEEFPSMTSHGESTSFELSGHELGGALRRTAYATSTDESRYVLNGILMEDVDLSLCFIATDGRRLAKCELGSNATVNAILPNKAVSMLLRSVDAAEIITVSVGQGWAQFDASGLSIQTKLIEGSFPNWRQVMPGKATASVRISRQDLLNSVKRVGIMVNERTNAITLEFSGSQVVLSANSPDVGEAKEQVDCEGGVDLKTAVNPLYMTQCLAALTSDSITIDLIDEASPLTIQDNGFSYVVMPMRAN